MKITLCIMVVTVDKHCLWLKREVEMPFVPAVGTTVWGAEDRGPDSDPSESAVESVSYDIRTGEIEVHLDDDDMVEWEIDNLCNNGDTSDPHRYGSLSHCMNPETGPYRNWTREEL